MRELFFPATDGGVAIQLVIVLAVGAALVLVTKRMPDLRLLVIGLSILALALLALRALH